MSVQIAVKNIKYDFTGESREIAAEIREYAVKSVKALYQEEQDFQKEEFEAMLANGEVSNYSEYLTAIGADSNSVDYTKSFEENENHPLVQKQINELADGYLRNYFDLPQDIIVTVQDGFEDDEVAISTAVRKMFLDNVDVKVKGFGSAAPAGEQDIMAQRAYERIGEMMESSDFTAFLTLRASIGKYSSNNISMIYAQEPDARAVMGAKAWNAYDRHVADTNQGLKIWFPDLEVLQSKADVEKYVEANSTGNPKYDKKETDKLMSKLKKNGEIKFLTGFHLGTVYELSQTLPDDPEHDNIDDIASLNKPLNKSLDNYESIIESMKAAAALVPLTVRSESSEQDALYNAVFGYAETVLREMPEKVKGIKSKEPYTGDMHQIETIMSAHLICSHIGIECTDKASLALTDIFYKDRPLTADTVKLGKRDMFMTAFDRACNVSDQFNKAFDMAFEKNKDIAVQKPQKAKADFER